METSYVDVPILESVTNIAKRNNGSQEVYLYHEKNYLKLELSGNYINYKENN